MSLITKHEQLAILDGILPHLLQHGEFSVTKIYVSLSELHEQTNEVENNCQVVSSYLIKNNFAQKVEIDDPNSLLVLTEKGEYLAASRSLSAFNRVAERELSDQELIERIPLLIANISPYGEFTLVPPLRPDPTNNIYHKPLFSVSYEEHRKNIEDMLLAQRMEYTSVIFNEWDNLSKDEKVIQYLINNGFVINRHDIKQPNKIYRQFTDKGRELKDCGSIEAFNKVQEVKLAEIVALQNDRKAETQRNKNQYFVNVSLAISTAITALFCLFEIQMKIREKHPHFYNKAFWLISGVEIPLLLSGTIIGLYYISKWINK